MVVPNAARFTVRMTSRYPRILTSLKRATPALLLTLTEACSGGQTTELNDDDCQQDPAWQELELEAVQESALAQLTGEYTAPLHWLDATTELPTPADDALVQSTTALQITHRYVGSPQATRSCTGSLLLPVVTTLRTDDAQLDAEFLSLFEVDPDGVPWFSTWTVTRDGEPWLPVARDHAEEAADAARAVEIYDRTAKSLPTWDEWVSDVGADRDACAKSFGTLTPGVRDAGAGHVCLPDVGLGVWPEACGGLDRVAIDVPLSSGVSFETLIDRLTTVEVLSDPEASLTLTVTPAGNQLCHTHEDHSTGSEKNFYLGQVEASIAFGSDQRTATGTVEWGSQELIDSLEFRHSLCVEVSDADALTKALRLSLPQYTPLTGCDAEERELCAASLARYQQLEAAAQDGVETATLCLSGSLLDRPTPRFSAVNAAGDTIEWTYQWTTVDSK
jgi:hypothetical protein